MPGVSTLSVYIGMRFLIAIFAVFGLCTVLIFMIDFVEMLRQAGKHGSIPVGTLVRITMLRLPAYTEILLPIAVLVGSIGTLLMLSRKSELAVMRAGGMSVWQFLRPGIVASYSKPPTPLHRYSRTSDVIYLTCLTDDPNGQRWGTWYSPANREIDIAIYYDMWRASNVNGIGGNSAQTWQRTAPKRHSSGSAAMYMDGHADGLERDKVTDIRSWDDGDYKRF